MSISEAERGKNVLIKPVIVPASKLVFDPVEMVIHVLGERASPFQALHYDNTSRNQDAFPLFYF